MRTRVVALPNSEEFPIVGCTQDEIAGLEQYADKPIPESYRCFLHTMGQRSGRLFRGSEALISQKHKLRLRDVAQRILAQSNSEYGLPDDAFVFLVHQGYQFLFFRCAEGDDPPVYLVSDREPQPRQLSERFSLFLEGFVTDLETLSAKSPQAFERI